MVIMKQKFINREDLRANKGVAYLFGDNLARQGMGGQAKHMRNEANAIGIATKVCPDDDADSFFNDDKAALFVNAILQDFKPAFRMLVNNSDPVLVVPYDGLGTGLSDLPRCAPKVNNWLENFIKNIEKIAFNLKEQVDRSGEKNRRLEFSKVWEHFVSLELRAFETDFFSGAEMEGAA